MRVPLAFLLSFALLPAVSSAQSADDAFTPGTSFVGLDATAAPAELPDGVLSARPWHVAFATPVAFQASAAHTDSTSSATPALADASATAAATTAATPVDDASAAQRRPMAFTYSDGYALRAKIHKYASVATLPLFGVEYLLGQKLYDFSTSETVRATHAGIATTLAGLFGVNTVTGVWNLWEGRKDPNHRTKRMLHGFLMLGADAGFLATGALAPDNEGGGDRSLHRTVAITSMGIATASYLIMLIGK